MASRSRRGPRILVLYRKSTYQVMVLERKDPRYLELLAQEDPTVAKLRTVHEEHAHTLETVGRTLKEFKLPHRLLYRAKVAEPEDADLVISVGGDGTFLMASHHIGDTPILGVVSSTASVGHFCTADASTFRKVVEGILENGLRPLTRIQRLAVSISGREVPQRVLNEVLICHGNPAATSRYMISVGKDIEEQKSSGIWISTAAGSTAAIGSAGGMILPLRSRRIQYLVREPYILEREQYGLLRGLIRPGHDLMVASKMEKGYLYLDGASIRYPFLMGDQIRVALHPHPLKVYGIFRQTPQETDEEAEGLE